MIDEELGREAIGLLATAAVMLLEDAHSELVTTPCDLDEARAVAATLERLGADVDALGAAAEVAEALASKAATQASSTLWSADDLTCTLARSPVSGCSSNRSISFRRSPRGPMSPLIKRPRQWGSRQTIFGCS